MLQYVSDKMQFNTFLNERKPSQNLSILCLVEALTLYLLQSSVRVIGSVDTRPKTFWNEGGHKHPYGHLRAMVFQTLCKNQISHLKK